MSILIQNEKFTKDFERLKNVSLNPERHTAANAYVHCKLVVQRADNLAGLNKLNSQETALLVTLAYLHDIGKTQGNARPSTSVGLLPGYGITDQLTIDYVKYHDINLPWYIAHSKGESPGTKAWRKLTTKVDINLLCLFMIADRVDCPGGWHENEPLMWFLEEVKNRGLLTKKLIS